MHPRRTADVAFSKHTFALRNSGQLLSGAGGLSVCFSIVCSGGAKIGGGRQTLNMAMGSQGHPIHLSLSLSSPEDILPPAHQYLTPGSKPLMRQVACPSPRSSWTSSHVTGVPCFSQQLSASVRNAEDPSPVSLQCLSC